MSGILSELRSLVFARRIARATESIAISLSELAQIERDCWAREAHIRPPSTNKTVIESMDIEAVNDRYRKELEAAEIGATLEDVS
jgi:hypothetical protein